MEDKDCGKIEYFHAYVKGAYQSGIDMATKFNDGEINYKAFYKVVTEKMLELEKNQKENPLTAISGKQIKHIN